MRRACAGRDGKTVAAHLDVQVNLCAELTGGVQ